MTGLDEVMKLRRSGLKPAAVFVDLVTSIGKYDAEQFAFAEASGTVRVTIAASDRLSDIDFGPLVGLRVHVCDSAGDLKRHRKVAAMVAAIEPAHLVMPILDGEELVVHQRWAGTPARTETFRA